MYIPSKTPAEFDAEESRRTGTCRRCQHVKDMIEYALEDTLTVPRGMDGLLEVTRWFEDLVAPQRARVDALCGTPDGACKKFKAGRPVDRSVGRRGKAVA